MKLKFALLTLAASSAFTTLASAQVYSYAWDSSLPLFGDNNAGEWKSVSFTQDVSTGIMSFSATLATNTVNGVDQDPYALWMSVTNGPTPDSVNGDYAAIYLMEGGNLFVTPYNIGSDVDHTIDPIIFQGSWDLLSVGNDRTFSFSLDTNIVNNWGAAPLSWKGTGFPYDAQGNFEKPLAIGAWIHSFGNSTQKQKILTVTKFDYDINFDPKGSGTGFGTWDIGNAPVTLVPEPSVILLGSLAMTIGLFRRKRLS